MCCTGFQKLGLGQISLEKLGVSGMKLRAEILTKNKAENANCFLFSFVLFQIEKGGGSVSTLDKKDNQKPCDHLGIRVLSLITTMSMVTILRVVFTPGDNKHVWVYLEKKGI